MVGGHKGVACRPMEGRCGYGHMAPHGRQGKQSEGWQLNHNKWLYFQMAVMARHVSMARGIALSAGSQPARKVIWGGSGIQLAINGGMVHKNGMAGRQGGGGNWGRFTAWDQNKGTYAAGRVLLVIQRTTLGTAGVGAVVVCVKAANAAGTRQHARR